MVAHVFWEDGEPFESDMLDQRLIAVYQLLSSMKSMRARRLTWDISSGRVVKPCRRRETVKKESEQSIYTFV